MTTYITGYEKKIFTVKDIPAADFIKGYADYLKKNNKVQLPNVNFEFSVILS